MPRHARNLGETGWAHIILRGINRENLFYDEEDYARFASTVWRFQPECNFELSIMCMMNNHVHMLLKEENGSYSVIIKKIAVSYANYYNSKYDRVGHVFQDRFRSEAVNDDHYYITVLRYIYQNPQKAGICPAADYPYTFLADDLHASGYFRNQTDLLAFLSESNRDCCLDFDSARRISDNRAAVLLTELSGCRSPQDLQCLDDNARDRYLRELKLKGASVRQLSRLTGINRNHIQRIRIESGEPSP